MAMRTGVALVLAAVALAAAGAGGAAAAGGQGDAAAQAEGEKLGATVERAIKAEGPFFTAEERAVIERKCGYAPGSYEGFEANLSNGVLRCTNGRTVDDAEMRALLAAAEPRIERRVEAVMERADIRGAIARVTEAATAEALRAVDGARIAERAAELAAAHAAEAAEQAAQEVERALAETRRARRETR